MEDGMTGLNPDEAKTQISNFFLENSGFGTSFDQEIHEFYHTLLLSWCSPKAVEFGENNLPKLFLIWVKFQNLLTIYL